MKRDTNKVSQFDPNLVLWMRMQEGPQTIKAFDYSGASNHGRIVGAAWSSPGMTFDGLSNYVDCGNGANLQFDNNNSFSIFTWVKYNFSTSKDLIDKHATSAGGQNYRGYALDITSGRISADLVGAWSPFEGIRKVYTGSSVITNDNNWHIIGFTYNGSYTGNGLRLYVDGIELTSSITTITNLTGSSMLNTRNLAIGQNQYQGYFFTGTIDDVRIYNIALSADQINSIFQSTRSKYGV